MLAIGHHHPVNLVPDHDRQRIANLVAGPHLDQRKAGQPPDGQAVQRRAVQDRPLQASQGKNSQCWRHGLRVTHQQSRCAQVMKLPGHFQNGHVRIDEMRGAHKGFIDPRHRQRLQLVPALPLGQGAELVGQVGKQQRAKGDIGSNQVADRLPGQLVGNHFFCRHESAADLARHQSPAVKVVVWAIGGDHFIAVELLDESLDDDKQVRWLRTKRQNRGTLRKIGNVDIAIHQALLILGQTVKRRSGKVKCAGHAELPNVVPCWFDFPLSSRQFTDAGCPPRRDAPIPNRGRQTMHRPPDKRAASAMRQAPRTPCYPQQMSARRMPPGQSLHRCCA